MGLCLCCVADLNGVYSRLISFISFIAVQHDVRLVRRSLPWQSFNSARQRGLFQAGARQCQCTCNAEGVCLVLVVHRAGQRWSHGSQQWSECSPPPQAALLCVSMPGRILGSEVRPRKFNPDYIKAVCEEAAQRRQVLAGKKVTQLMVRRWFATTAIRCNTHQPIYIGAPHGDQPQPRAHVV